MSLVRAVFYRQNLDIFINCNGDLKPQNWETSNRNEDDLINCGDLRPFYVSVWKEQPIKQQKIGLNSGEASLTGFSENSTDPIKN
jgi:hypothetical protein